MLWDYRHTRSIAVQSRAGVIVLVPVELIVLMFIPKAFWGAPCVRWSRRTVSVVASGDCPLMQRIYLKLASRAVISAVS